MKKLLKEPLLHFLVIGVVLFGVYAWRNQGVHNDAGGRQVRIRESDVAWLKETWTRQWQREPDREELRGLVTELLKEELLSREAREMGLDQNDVFVRRRLAQKVEFMVQDASRLAAPTEEDLRRFHAAYPERFSEPARVSFTHVYFSRENRKDPADDAKSALAKLRAAQASTLNPQLAEVGDRLMLDAEFSEVEQPAVAGLFGAKFASAMFALSPGAWQGPIESGYGLHLVYVSARTAAGPREFTEVRTQVLERWQDQRQREDNQKYFTSLLRKYDVTVDASVQPLVGVLGEDSTGADPRNGGPTQ